MFYSDVLICGKQLGFTTATFRALRTFMLPLSRQQHDKRDYCTAPSEIYHSWLARRHFFIFFYIMSFCALSFFQKAILHNPATF